MSFADIINAEQKKLDSQNGGDKVGYPETKNKRLFFEKGQTELLMQVLPAANLVGAPAEPARKIFLTALSSQGKDIKSNFTLDPEPNAGSLLEAKVTEWAQAKLIPNGFGGQQTPKRIFLVNAVKIVPNPAQPGTYMQERDEKGDLAVRVFEMPQSAYGNLIRKLQDPLFNTGASELSFMDPNKPAPIKVMKPGKNQMEYPVEVYTNVALPALGQGWESQLEDLTKHSVPTERLENGYNWVQAFIDMKEGRKPQNRNNDQQANTQGTPAPQANPYAQQQGTPAPQADPFANPAPQQGTPAPQADPFANPAPQQGTPAPQADPFASPAPSNLVVEDDPFAGSQLADPPVTATPQQTPAPQTPPQPPVNAPAQQAAPSTPQSHNVNDSGLNDIDAMLESELNGL